MASFMVIYLKETLGMRPTFATFLNGSLLWGLIYFMPILSGTLADKYGYKRSLTVAFVLISAGYFTMGNVQRFWPGLIGRTAAEAVDFTVPVVLGIVLIGIGGSIVKPCIAGTVQKTSGTAATLGLRHLLHGHQHRLHHRAGRVLFHPDEPRHPGHLHLRLFDLRPHRPGRRPVLLSGSRSTSATGRRTGRPSGRRRSGQAVLGIFVVLRNARFVFFLIVIGLFWVLYVQLYNLMPLFLRAVDPNAPMELYTLANPVMIVAFQMLITRVVKKWTPIKSILFGVAVTTTGMLMNVLPALLGADLSRRVDILGLALPFAGVFLIVSIASMAVGEMMASPRIYEYIGAIAPKGEEGLYLGYANLPVALGSIFGGPLGGALFERYISTPMKEGRPTNSMTMWLIIAGIGLVSMTGLAIYDRLLTPRPRLKPEAIKPPAEPPFRKGGVKRGSRQRADWL